MIKKNVLITGGSRGIGRACTERFSGDGYTVAFIYRQDDTAAAEVSRVTGAYAIHADLSVPCEATAAVKEAAEYMGGIGVVVNCAGISQIKLFTDTTDGDFRRLTDTNLGSAYTVSREAAKYMIKQKYGRIINIGSMWGKTGASCEVIYSAVKAGIRGMTMALAKELGPSGITVNCIEPGVIDTDMNRGLDDETRAGLIDSTPLGRIGTPADVAAAVAFLASDSAEFITGQILGVDGGFAV